MNVALRTRMTADEFMVWEAKQELKWEFDGIRPIAMAGGTSEHAALQRNLAISLGGRLSLPFDERDPGRVAARNKA